MTWAVHGQGDWWWPGRDCIFAGAAVKLGGGFAFAFPELTSVAHCVKCDFHPLLSVVSVFGL